MSTRGFRYVYGPVPSRRLGRSLGIDLVPFKTCTFDCVYCQLGRTTDKTIERKEYVAVKKVLEELERKLAAGDIPDYISLAGSGEPTLNSGIGDLICRIKDLTDIPVAVLTNGSLLWMSEVRDALKSADLVLPSLDAGDDRLFRYVNRPHEAISFEQMVDGMAEFARHFPGEVWLEVLLLAGVTGISSEVKKIAALAKRIAPSRVQLNTVSRPPSEEFAFALSADQMLALRGLFQGQVDIISEGGQDSFYSSALSDTKDVDIISLLSRRPCTCEDIAIGLGIHVAEAFKYLDALITAGKVSTVISGGRRFYTVTGSERDCKKEISKNSPEVIARYLQSCQTEFWQKVFQFELDYLIQHLKGCIDILSVGCGPAIIESALSERGFRVTGLDVSQEALDRAPDSIRTVTARAEDMPFPESSFDAVIYVASLQFIEDYRKAIEKTVRVLRPDGRLVVMLLNPESEFFKAKLCDPNSYVQKIRHMDLRKIEAVIADNFSVHTEYNLGVKGDIIFASRDVAEAVLYIIRGTKKQKDKDKDV